MHVVVVSPHLDDAVWSCGGWISALAAAGHSVEIATVFSDAGPDTATRQREDEAAAARVGAVSRWLGFTDAAYRRDEQGDLMYRRVLELFGRRRPTDERLPPAVAAALAAAAANADLVVAPLGCGRHVDHVITADAVRAAAPPDEVTWYHEVPYAPGDRLDGLTPELHEVAEADWLAAALIYESQIPAIVSEERLRADIAARVIRRDGRPHQRFWRLPRDPR